MRGQDGRLGDQANRGDLCQFFTSDSCSETLVAEIDITPPDLIVDVGAGHGSLAIAAIRRWGEARMALFDRDPLALDVLKRACPGAARFQADLLIHRLPRNIGQWLDKADVVLCNPPFRRAPIEVADRWLAAADMPTYWPSRIKKRAELVFFAHNLRLLRQGGELAMILPATFINGHEFEPFRAWLLHNLTVSKVIQLPTTAFSQADVRSYAIIARKLPAPEGHLIRLIDLSKPSSVARTLAITPEEGITRLDLAFHYLSDQADKSITLGNFGAKIHRGTPVSVLKKLDSPYFHTTDFAHHAPGAGLQCPVLPRAITLPMAKAGDILLGRIGRNCHRQVLKIVEGMIPFSDCVYRIEVPATIRASVIASLADPQGLLWRQAHLHGSTVNLLSKKDLLRHPIWIHQGAGR